MVTIVLIEDNTPYADLIEEMLYTQFSSSRVTLIHRTRLQDGLAAAREHQHDLMLLDLTLPDSDGFQTFLNAQEVLPDTPIIVMTGLDDEFMANQALEQGAQDYLVKNKLNTHWLANSVRHAIARKKIEREVHTLALFPEGNPNPVLRITYDARIEYANKRSEDLLASWGCQRDEQLPAPWPTLVETCLFSKQTIQREERIHNRVYAFTIAPYPALQFVYLYGEDITQRKQVEEQLRHGALHDSLTGLPNRTLFMEHLSAAISKLNRDNKHLFAVLFLDIDRFKNINDSLGHQAGDTLLMHVARTLRGLTRPSDILARLSGDEFALLLDDLESLTDARRVAERIQQEFKLPYSLHNRNIFVSVSIGITGCRDSQDPGDYLRDAEIAMYRAKGKGHIDFQIFNQEMHAQTVKQMEMESDMRQALDQQGFHLNYQPVVSLQTRTIVGFEALIRWIHPIHGFVSPPEFIPLAEENGLIVPITWWVLEEACRQTHTWQQQFAHCRDLSISVNFSSKQFVLPHQTHLILQILERTGLAPDSLKLEITEGALMSDVGQAAQMLQELRSNRIELYMDDFGTGYSSLNYLHRFELDVLKIDRSFVMDMDTDQRKNKLVQTFLDIANNFDMRVIAEGVETKEQAALLHALGCDCVQGYYFSRPLNANDATALLEQNLTWPTE